MGRKPKISQQRKLEAVKKYLSYQGSFASISQAYHVHPSVIREWVRQYKSIGIQGLMPKKKNNLYTKYFKEQVVMDYLSGSYSIRDLANKYKIPSNSTVLNWIKKYNSNKKLKIVNSGGITIMKNGRKTTFDERINIVKFCIENELNYNKTAEKFNVSYQQVYTWVKKYESKGVNGLQDRRGRSKDQNELSEMEKLKQKTNY